MRGFGAPHYETATEALTRPDWGWGDVPPSTWDSSSADYGWGSARSFAFSPYLLNVSELGDDGGYKIQIRGSFPRLGASVRQRPTGFIVQLTRNGNVFTCHSGRAGQQNQCSTDLRASVLTAYTPRLDLGDYTVSFSYDSTSVDVGTISIVTRTRTLAEYEMRDAMPSRYKTEARRLEIDTLITNNAPSARLESHSVLSALTRSIGQSIAEFYQSGIVTRLTSDLSPSDTFLEVETTLGMPDAGGIFIDGVHFRYATKTAKTLNSITRTDGQINTISAGERVTHDPHTIAD